MIDQLSENIEGSIAIIGIAGRFPGAKNVDQFWRNIRDGIDCISDFSARDLEVSDARDRIKNPDYVAARSVLDGVDLFDADFFGMLPREVELIDPQHRIFLEICWEALEDAGYVPQDYTGSIGVYGGCAPNSYFMRNLCVDRKFIEEYTDAYQVGCYPTLLGTNADFLATRVSYKLNLSGPSLTLQTACSTSLVAICQASSSLLSYQCDMALAGGVSITFPQKRGALYQEGGMISRDGRCRSFDVASQGTVFGSGAGVVLLKRLGEAIADGDHIEAVIRGFAVNNDGSAKVGYTAPSGDGQSKVIAMAHEFAGVDPESIGYVEAHGTGTPLGDPIEFVALTRVFRSRTANKGFCALGSSKRNVGHLDVAAGVVGLINAVQVVKHKQIPPAVNFTAPNPNIDMANSPFYVSTKLTPWERGSTPRRAGVSAFGVGGTNAHVVIEEGLGVPTRESSLGPRLLVISARSGSALDHATTNLVAHLKANPSIDLDSVAWTLQTGRREFEHRMAVVCHDVEDAIRVLEGPAGERIGGRSKGDRADSVTFMFPGQGAQCSNMGLGLYRDDPAVRGDIDACAEILRPHLGLDIRAAIYPGTPTSAPPALNDTFLAQPALFVIEYALASLWMRWGVKPRAMIGHSVGEYVAACLAGVFSLDDALAIIAARGRMMRDLAPGAMLSVRLGEDDVRSMLNGEMSLAAVNSSTLSVISGSVAAIEGLDGELARRGVVTRRLATSHAFHSRMMDPLVKPFAEFLRQFRFNPPTIPYVSSVTGDFITAGEATDPAYWARQLREPVRFAKGIGQFRDEPGARLLEVGPGRTLSTLAQQNWQRPADAIVVASLRESPDPSKDRSSVLEAAASLWVNGTTLDFAAIHSGERTRCSLPTYPFERKRYWIDAPPYPNSTPKTNGRQGMAKVEALPSSRTEEIAMSESSHHPIATTGRIDRILEALNKIFGELSGLTMTDVDPSANFLELGFDSLFLTQAAQLVQSRFGLKVTFRQLLDQLSSLSALSGYIDRSLPDDIFRDDAPPAPAPITAADLRGSRAMPEPGSSPASVPPGSLMQSVVREQLQAMSQLMARQLAMLQGAGVEVESSVGSMSPAPAHNTKSPSSMTGPVTSTPSTQPFSPFRPLQKGTVGEVTEQQNHYLDTLIARYSARTSRSKAYTQAHRKTLADPRVAAGFRARWKEMVYPIVVERSSGSRLWDVDGNEYIDILNGFGPIFFGHAPRFIAEAVEQQLRKGFEIGPQTPLAGQVADLIRELTGMDRVTFCNTGSEAVMAALRLSRAVTGRSRIVLFAGDYHGNFGEVLVKKVPSSGGPRSMPIAPGIPVEEVANATVLEYGTPESLAYIRTHADELAAVLVEPVQSRHPALQPVEFLRELREITSGSGTALIFDEVVTGFRSHPGGAQAVFGIRADLAAYGKVVGGGLPIGVLAGSPRFMDALDGGMWQYGDDSCPEAGVTFFAGTFVRHPLALASAYAVLTHLKESGPALQLSLNERTSKFVADLNIFLEERGAPIRIEHFASFFYFSFPPEHRFGSLFYYLLREKGVHIQEGYPCFLTTAHSDADLEQVSEAFKQSILEMQEGGVLPKPSSFGSAEKAPIRSAAPAAEIELPIEAPLTESQLEIWLSAQISDEANCSFNESLTIQLGGPLDSKALHSALQQLIDRHDALRATFDPSGTRQRFLDRIEVDLPLIDFSTLAPSERAQQIDRLVRDDSARPFDLIAGPMVRALLVRLESEQHALILTTHHIVCDGWSTNVLLEELGHLYDAARRNAGPDLAPPPRFVAYAESLAESALGPERSAVETWWIEKFTSPVSPLELPTDRPRGSLKSFSGHTIRRAIGIDSCRRIKEFGARQGCTLYATLLAGFQVLLNRLSDQDDLVVGIPAAGQSLLPGELLVGHCVNFLPIRVTFPDDPSVSRALRIVKEGLLDAQEHQSYTYGSLVRRLEIPRDPSRLPLVEVQFNLERVGSRLEFPGLEVAVQSNRKSFVNFDLFLNVVEFEGGLELDCDYNTDLFDRTTVERWLGHYEVLLEKMASNPDQPLSALSLLDDNQSRTLVVEWNQTRSEFPGDKCLHHLVSEQAARTPRDVAVVFEGRPLTYGELDAAANQLAHYLRKLGLRIGSRVAICVERSPQMLIGVLGVLKAGGAYVPLDPSYPAERIAAVLRDAEPVLLLTQADLEADIEPTSARVIRLDADWPEIGRESASEPSLSTTSSDLAYLIYTSGSSGRPKGVMISHRAVVNFLCAMAKRPGLTADDTIVAVTTLAFDIAVLELFLPLSVGARVVIASREVASDGHALLALLNSSRATLLQATPATWRLLIEAGWKGGEPGLKVLCGGEALPRDLADALLARSSSVWNMYGPTETTVWSSSLQLQPETGPVPIGPPITNTTFYVLDRQGRPSPIGVPGELSIGGEGIAEGYWGQPTLTAEKFVEDPFDGRPGSRLYRTGDSVRYRADGTLEFLGRLDTQVKVRGFRIETAEIEFVLEQYPGVKGCVVTTSEFSPGDKRLVAYLVSEASNLEVRDLRSFIAARLPDYMVPSTFMSIDALPLTPNGKVDRRALSRLKEVKALEVDSYVAPTSPHERKLAEICTAVLGLDRVGITTSLFDLGADSLQMFQIVARAREAGIQLSLRQILLHRNLSAICAEVEKSGAKVLDSGAPQLVPVSREQYRSKLSLRP